MIQMQPGTCDRLLDRCADLAVRAGAAILELAESAPGTAEAKADGSPVTRADLAAHHLILHGLLRTEPRFPILSEEGETADAAWNPAARQYWCVDPLDGTKEFISGTGEYTVNIALVEDAQPSLGVVYLPALDTLYAAAVGAGAWRLCRAAAIVKADSAAWRHRAVPLPDEEACRGAGPEPVAVASRSHLSTADEAFLRAHSIRTVVRHGSSMKMCAVAEGSADVYPRLGPTCLWDTAAGCAVARAAGCAVVEPVALAPLAYAPAAGLKHAGFIVYRPERFVP